MSTEASAAILTTRNPATGEVVAEHQISDEAAVHAAVGPGTRRPQAGGPARTHGSAGRTLLRWKRELVNGSRSSPPWSGRRPASRTGGALFEMMLAVEHLDWAARQAPAGAAPPQGLLRACSP